MRTARLGEGLNDHGKAVKGARILVSLPRRIPLVILRGSGETTAALSRLAAENGVRTLAHAEGGGVLYVHGSASQEKALTLAEASLDRLGVCNRLNLALVDREAVEIVPALLRQAKEPTWFVQRKLPFGVKSMASPATVAAAE